MTPQTERTTHARQTTNIRIMPSKTNGTGAFKQVFFRFLLLLRLRITVAGHRSMLCLLPFLYQLHHRLRQRRNAWQITKRKRPRAPNATGHQPPAIDVCPSVVRACECWFRTALFNWYLKAYWFTLFNLSFVAVSLRVTRWSVRLRLDTRQHNTTQDKTTSMEWS